MKTKYLFFGISITIIISIGLFLLSKDQRAEISQLTVEPTVTIFVSPTPIIKNNPDNYYLFSVTSSRATYSSDKYIYQIETVDFDQYLVINSKENGSKVMKTKLDIDPVSSIMSISPNEQYITLFAHNQNYGGSVLHIFDISKQEVTATIENSIGDVHWFKNYAYFSDIKTSCINDCKSYTVQTVLNKIKLNNRKISQVLNYTDVDDELKTISVMEKYNDSFVIGLTNPREDVPYEYRLIDIKDENTSVIAKDDLKAIKLLQTDFPHYYRIQKLNNEYIIVNFMNRDYLKVFQVFDLKYFSEDTASVVEVVLDLPVGSTIVNPIGDELAKIITNEKSAISFSTAHEGLTLEYSSFKKITSPIFGDFYRVTLKESNLITYSQEVSDAKCRNGIEAPCGQRIFEGLEIVCSKQSSVKYCDEIVKSIVAINFL